MKKVLALTITAGLVICMAGCGENETSAEVKEETGTDSINEEETIIDEENENADDGDESTVEDESEAEEDSSESGGAAFLEPFDKSPQIKKTVLWDEQDVKVTATDLSYENSLVYLNLALENDSDKPLTFKSDYRWAAVNGYTLSTFFNLEEEVEPGETIQSVIRFEISDLSSYGINEIADIEFNLEVSDEDDNSFTLPVQKIETNAAGSYDYETDTYQEVLKNGVFEQINDCLIDYLSFDELYSNGGVSIVSEAVVKPGDEDDNYLNVILEVVNDTDYDIIGDVSDVCVNGDSIWNLSRERKVILAGTRGLVYFDTNVSPFNPDDDIPYDETNSVSFTFAVKNEDDVDALPSEDITIDLQATDDN